VDYTDGIVGVDLAEVEMIESKKMINNKIGEGL